MELVTNTIKVAYEGGGRNMSKLVSVELFRFEELTAEVQKNVIARVRDEDYYIRCDDINRDYENTLSKFEEMTREFLGSHCVSTNSFEFYFNGASSELYTEEFDFSGRPARMKAWLYNNLINPFTKWQVYRSPIWGSLVAHESEIMPARDYNVTFENLDITGTFSDHDLLQAIVGEYRSKSSVKKVGNAMHNIFTAFFSAWSASLEWITSDEAVRESLEELDTWYTKEGKEFTE